MSKDRIFEIDRGEFTTITVGVQSQRGEGSLAEIQERLRSIGYASEITNRPDTQKPYKLILVGPDVFTTDEYIEAASEAGHNIRTIRDTWVAMRCLAASAFEETILSTSGRCKNRLQYRYHYPDVPFRVLTHPSYSENPLSRLMVKDTIIPGIEWVQAQNPSIPGITSDVVDVWRDVSETL